MMMRSLFLLSIFFFFSHTGFGSGPTTHNIQLANIHQDLEAITQQIGHMRLEIEKLQNENIQLKKIANTTLSVNDLNHLKEEMIDYSNKQKQEIITIISQQLETISHSTPKSQFANNYPKEGIQYTVKKGDTLGKIAIDNQSSIKDIQNANQIADPNKDLRIGQTIFIPQRKQ